jgi:hypothetical protein
MTKKEIIRQNMRILRDKEKTSHRNRVSGRQFSANETPVPLLDPELKKWIKVVRPSRSSLTYERME